MAYPKSPLFAAFQEPLAIPQVVVDGKVTFLRFGRIKGYHVIVAWAFHTSQDHLSCHRWQYKLTYQIVAELITWSVCCKHFPPCWFNFCLTHAIFKIPKWQFLQFLQVLDRMLIMSDSHSLLPPPVASQHILMPILSTASSKRLVNSSWCWHHWHIFGAYTQLGCNLWPSPQKTQQIHGTSEKRCLFDLVLQEWSHIMYEDVWGWYKGWCA